MTTVERITATALDKKTAKRYAAQIASDRYGRAARKIKYLGGGSFGRAFGVLGNDGERFVIKFLRVNGRMEKETHDLALLAQSCRSVKLPRVLFTRKADGKIPVDCYGMERIDGKNALFSLGMLLMRKSRLCDLPTRSRARCTRSTSARATSSATRYAPNTIRGSIFTSRGRKPY